MFDPYEINSPSANRPKKYKRKDSTGSGYASFLRRALSVLIDLAIIAAVLTWYDYFGQTLLFEYLQNSPNSWLSIHIKRMMQSDFSSLLVWISLVALLPIIINNGLIAWIFGGTIGQKISGIHVVNRHNMRIGFLRTMFRLICCYPMVIALPVGAKLLGKNLTAGMTQEELVTLATSSLAIPYMIMLSINLISIVTVLLTKEKRAVHDYLAGTYVIR